MRKRLLTLALALAMPVAADSHQHAAHQAQQAGLEIAHPYVRAVPPGQPNSAAFMAIHNPTMEDAALVAVRSEVAQTVELHTHRMADGVMRMRRIERIPVAAGHSVQLQPGGHHVMLIGLRQPLKEGDRVELTLVFDNGVEQRIQAPVQRVMAGMKSHAQHGPHGHPQDSGMGRQQSAQ